MLNGATMQGESNGRRFGANGQLLTSSAGALGEMQVLPSTARDPGFGVRPWQGGADDLARVGRDYRATMQNRYGGDLSKMWAAYNAGPGRVDAAVSRLGPSWLTAMSPTTRAYVARNLKSLGAQ